ncbi:MAG TPA: cytochrome c [Methylophilaceae bacterium]|nr:cytochrome c [Methylophilaceae bacterium]
MSQDHNISPDEPLNEPLENETSTLAIHDAVMREAADPHEAFDPGPRWFYFFTVAALVIGSFYLGRHMGEFSLATHIGYLPPGVQAAAVTAAANGAAGEKAKPEVSGAAIFTSKCSACHQADGKGVPGAFPPLVASPFVLGDPVVTINIILHGLQGQIDVGGQTYNGLMPPWADQLSDAEIAAVVTHIRGNLGSNKASAVDEALVAKTRQQYADRKTPWTADELSQAAKKAEGKQDETSQSQATQGKATSGKATEGEASQDKASQDKAAPGDEKGKEKP